MQSLGAQAWIWAAAFLTAGIAVVGAFLAPATFWSRVVRFRWWFAGLGVLVLAWIFLVVLRRQYPPETFVETALPPVFLRGYWAWLLLFLLGFAETGRLRGRALYPALLAFLLLAFVYENGHGLFMLAFHPDNASLDPFP